MGNNVIQVEIFFNDVEITINGKKYNAELNAFKKSEIGKSIIEQGHKFEDFLGNGNGVDITIVNGNVIRINKD